MPHASCFSHTLHFTFRAGTSRGVMTQHDTHFIVIEDGGQRGIGECAPLPGLSVDDRPDFAQQLQRVVDQVRQSPPPTQPEAVPDALDQLVPTDLPAVRFGLETAWLDLLHGGQRWLFPAVMQPRFTPLPINGLVWMSDADTMLRQLDEKLAAGFRCVKLKIGAIDFDEELRLLAHVRERYDPDAITLRVDANGAFAPDEALDKLTQLARYDVHSIEQPIRPGQWEAMAALCQHSPVPIALDEELIGITSPEDQARLLDTIRPPYIILKPTLLGGLAAADGWIRAAEARNIRWWATSALESNVGLNAIAQWVAQYRPTLPQGLGTGQLYHNNIGAPMVIDRGYLTYNPDRSWDLLLFESVGSSSEQ